MSENVHRTKQEAAELGRQANELLQQAGHALLRATELDRHRQARLDAIETFTEEGFDPEWPTALRELADKLMQIPPDVAGTDQGHADLCTSIAAFLDVAFGDGVGAGGDALAETLGVPIDDDGNPESAHDLVSSALSKAEANRGRRVAVTGEGDD